MRPNIPIAIALTLSAAAKVNAADLVFPDRGRAAVVDAAHVLPAATAEILNGRIGAWDRATGHQLVVATVPSLQGLTIAEYGYRLGRAWGLGRKGINDGAILLLAPTERKVRIEVGRGLEGDLTDAQSSAILSGVVAPKLKAGDVSGALSAGADAIMSAVPANAGDMANAPTPPTHSLWWPIGILGTVFGLLFTAVLAGRWRKARAEREFYAVDERWRAHRDRVDRVIEKSRAAPEVHNGVRGGYQPRSSDAGPHPIGGSGASYEPRPSSLVVAPVIINTSEPESRRRRDEDSYSSTSSSSSWSDSSSSPSSTDWGSSGFDSGGGDFGGGGADTGY